MPASFRDAGDAVKASDHRGRVCHRGLAERRHEPGSRRSEGLVVPCDGGIGECDHRVGVADADIRLTVHDTTKIVDLPVMISARTEQAYMAAVQ